MSTQPNSSGLRASVKGLQLEFPMSLGTYDNYADAQRAVDYLSDNNFPVQKVLIVGADLKQMERVTGRLTWGRVILSGIASGAFMGLFVALIFALFLPSGYSALALFLQTMLFGAVFGATFAAIAYAMTRGQRDFTSVMQIIATKYEVLCEHNVADQGRELLAKMS